jgi:hypothetical protein
MVAANRPMVLKTALERARRKQQNPDVQQRDHPQGD